MEKQSRLSEKYCPVWDCSDSGYENLLQCIKVYANSWVHLLLWKQGSYKDHYALHWLSNWSVFAYNCKVREAGFLSHMHTAGICIKHHGVFLQDLKCSNLDIGKLVLKCYNGQ
ncbi:uncharacterized protein LOC110942443 [Helianthus annuus]|uniref:uncharacterized protein LOC110942443 n=1 Tax=Helianthus annuus TaxID=4232 RepID=UPI000B8FA56F|nr:uncharacterized protein LOC110942443 [Helianthus annuus]